MIHCKGLRVQVSGTTALDAPEIGVGAGEVLGVIGPPDAGKSVLLKTLAGLLPMTDGSVAVNGDEVAPRALRCPRWRARVGMAFQNDALFDTATVFENIAFVLRRRGVSDVDTRARTLAILDRVGLSDAASLFPHEISGGMSKRVGVARAMIAEPELGLFDEPTAGLDPQTGGLVLELILSLTAQTRMATVIASNEVEALIPRCDRILMLHAGEVLFLGDAAKIHACDHPAVRQFISGDLHGPL